MDIYKVPVNFGALSRKSGQEEAPDAIVEKLKDFYLKENRMFPVFEVKEIPVDNSSIAPTVMRIEQAVASANHPSIILGGDHSVTYGSFRGFCQRYSNPGIIIFDAHADCMDFFSPPTHEDYLRVLIEEGKVKPENVLIVGLRNVHQFEQDFLKGRGIKTYDMKEIAAEGKNEVCDAVMAAARGFDGLYVSVDIDVLDPAFAPGTGYTEPGGMTTRELLYFIQRIKLLKNLSFMDVVEVNPTKDVSGLTVSAAAKIVTEML